MQKEKQVFRYRSGSMWIIVAFLGVWSTGWMAGTIANWKNPRVEINDRPATPEQARNAMQFALVIGVAASCATIGVALCIANAKIVLDSGVIEVYDLLGRRTFTGTLATAEVLEGIRVLVAEDGAEARATIRTAEGYFYVSPTICRFTEFIETIVDQTNNAQPRLPSRKLLDGLSIVPKVYSYRKSGYIWIPLIFVGLAISILRFVPIGSSPTDLAILLFGVVICAYFFGKSILKGVNERITVSQSELVVFDLLGREKIRTGLDSVQRISRFHHAKAASRCGVFTSAGYFILDPGISDYFELVEILDVLVEENRPVYQA